MAGIIEKAFTSPVGRKVAARAGLAEPPTLVRGRQPVPGAVVLAELPGGGIARRTLDALGVSTVEPVLDLPENRTKGEEGRDQAPRYAERPGAIVIDATGVRSVADLEAVRQVLRPAVKGIRRSGRIVLLATDADDLTELEAKYVQQSLDGITRTVAKELRGGATANLVFVRSAVEADDLRSTLSFLLEGRSAFVDGQVWRVGRRKDGDRVGPDHDPRRPYAGRVVVVTGASRGIGAAIARTFARDGAKLVLVDVPAAGDRLAAVANEVRGSALQLDITGEGAGRRIAAHVASVHGPDARIFAIVHNAGITRDKMMANLDEAKWAQVLDVNLSAQVRMNEELFDPDLPGGLAENARFLGIASTSGVAGNKGQANYAASKAGVMGLVWAGASMLKDLPITINAVAPGFIETDMTAAIPFVQREIFRRANSLQQGGQPVDVAETIGYLCDPESGGVNGQVVRVCGQNLVGA